MSDTLRVGDRAVPLAEIETEIFAATHEVGCGNDTPWTLAADMVWDDHGDAIVSCDPAGRAYFEAPVGVVVLHAVPYMTALIAEVRALREQVEAAYREGYRAATESHFDVIEEIVAEAWRTSDARQALTGEGETDVSSL